MSGFGAVAIYTACAAADLGSTAVAVGRGGVERNPLLGDEAGGVQWGRAVAAKVAVTAGLAIIDHQIAKRDRRAVRWFRGVVMAVYLGVAVRNLRVQGVR